MGAGAPALGSAGLHRPTDCETLIRRMLVVDPAKRITIAQIRQHRWMQAGPSVPRQACPTFSAPGPGPGSGSGRGHYDEQALGIMHSLGIDRQRTVEVSAHPAQPHALSAAEALLARKSRHWPVELKWEHGLI